MKKTLLLFALLLPSFASTATTYTVCASGCDSTTISGAFSSASAGDTIELQEDITESGVFWNKGVSLQSDSGNKWTWTSTGGTNVNMPANNITTDISFTDLVLKNTGGSSAFGAFNTLASPRVMTFTNVIFDKTSSGNSSFVFNGVASGALVTLEKCEFVGNDVGGSRCIDSGVSSTGTMEIFNCICRDHDIGFNFYSGSATDVVKVYNTTVYSNTQGVSTGQSNDYQNVAWDNTTDLNFYGSASCSDVSYSAFGQQSSPCGSNNTFNLVDTDAWTDPSNGDFTVKDTGSDLYNAGTDLSPDVTDDYVGTARPQSTSYDIGAYEFVAAGPTPTPTPAPGPASGSRSLLGVGL